MNKIGLRLLFGVVSIIWLVKFIFVVGFNYQLTRFDMGLTTFLTMAFFLRALYDTFKVGE
ncbi:hypothetical protein [Clostridium sp.]|uniref:hypothetical protein n=1 Tax=Clostridium sp. TaxID=1506 RepID=UPI00260A28F1|nr:hypothetical protein [Clostridium sp.]